MGGTTATHASGIGGIGRRAYSTTRTAATPAPADLPVETMKYKIMGAHDCCARSQREATMTLEDRLRLALLPENTLFVPSILDILWDLPQRFSKALSTALRHDNGGRNGLDQFLDRRVNIWELEHVDIWAVANHHKSFSHIVSEVFTRDDHGPNRNAAHAHMHQADRAGQPWQDGQEYCVIAVLRALQLHIDDEKARFQVQALAPREPTCSPARALAPQTPDAPTELRLRGGGGSRRDDATALPAGLDDELLAPLVAEARVLIGVSVRQAAAPVALAADIGELILIDPRVRLTSVALAAVAVSTAASLGHARGLARAFGTEVLLSEAGLGSLGFGCRCAEELAPFAIGALLRIAAEVWAPRIGEAPGPIFVQALDADLSYAHAASSGRHEATRPCSGAVASPWAAANGEGQRDLPALIAGVTYTQCCGSVPQFRSGHLAMSALFPPDRPEILTASYDSAAKIWRVGSGECLRALEGNGHVVITAAFSLEGLWVLTVGPGECLRALEGHDHAARSAASAPDRLEVLSASYDGTAKIWRGGSRECLRALDGHGYVAIAAVVSLVGQPVLSAAFSLDGLEVLTASQDFRRLRGLFVELILATDMASHKRILDSVDAALERFARTPPVASLDGGLGPGSAGEAMLLLQVAVKCADLGHVTLSRAAHLRYVRRLEEELFAQGDRERELGLEVSFLMDREMTGVASSQVEFFEDVALPLFRRLAMACRELQPLLEGAEGNYWYWRGLQSGRPVAAWNDKEKNRIFIREPQAFQGKLDELLKAE
ncbi:unnamed protein product [Prorocentrum cordatum]|uniref:PDEase domain-containing protein n=1 Tax=Prorocentrum cordatum TaxID=2364126 RepID=A0ABN9W7G6_9DINO|nr:unnamed protein product [Polarella glacialis]